MVASTRAEAVEMELNGQRREFVESTRLVTECRRRGRGKWQG